MPAGMSEAYYEIMKNLKAEWERTGKVRGKKYQYWDKHSSGDAIHHAHQIAKSIEKSRYTSKQRSNQDLQAELAAFYDKTRKENMFNHPDYKHVHGNEYDPNK